ncbi:MAG: 30S ribosomal protein S21 [Nitrospirae bacterium]|nr:30S ribosomal protein S21 [Nitrospirota bacterium]
MESQIRGSITKRKEIRQLEIRVNGHIDKAIRLLKRVAEKEGLFRELKKRRFYEKPSVKKRRKQREAQKRRIKNARMRRQYK